MQIIVLEFLPRRETQGPLHESISRMKARTLLQTTSSASRIKSSILEARECHTSIPTWSLSAASTRKTSASQTKKSQGLPLLVQARCAHMYRRLFRKSIGKRAINPKQAGTEQLTNIGSTAQQWKKATLCTDCACIAVQEIHTLSCIYRNISY